MVDEAVKIAHTYTSMRSDMFKHYVTHGSVVLTKSSLAEVLGAAKDELKDLLSHIITSFAGSSRPLAIHSLQALGEFGDRVGVDANVVHKIQGFPLLVDISHLKCCHRSAASMHHISIGSNAILEVVHLHLGEVISIEHVLGEHDVSNILAS